MSTRILLGDAKERLKDIAPETVQVSVTSPPYWCLRKYSHPDQIGLEATPEDYCNSLVEVFRGVRRALHPTGLCFVNLGDSYSGGGRGPGSDGSKQKTNAGSLDLGRMICDIPPGNLVGIPWRFARSMQQDGWILRSAITLVKGNPMPQSMLGPRYERCRVKVESDEMTAQYEAEIAARMEKVGCDRVRASMDLRREYLRSRYEGRGKQAVIGGTYAGFNERWQQKYTTDGSGRNDNRAHSGGIDQQPSVIWQDCPGCEKCAPNNGYVIQWGSGRPTSATEMLFMFSKTDRYFFNHTEVGREAENGLSGGNCYDWMMWEPEPLSDAHYAAFPKFLPRWCIRAGAPDSCCSLCNAPYLPVIERGSADIEHQMRCGGDAGGQYGGQAIKSYADGGAQDASDVKRRILAGMTQKRITAWWPGCPCPTAPRRPIVLDCFGGSGTTALAASERFTDCILCELGEDYVQIAQKRIAKYDGIFADCEVE